VRGGFGLGNQNFIEQMIMSASSDDKDKSDQYYFLQSVLFLTMFIVCEIIPLLITLDSKSVEIFILEGRIGSNPELSDNLL